MKMKETLNLGKTKFPMRGNLPVKEVERQAEWNEEDVYAQRQEKIKIKHHGSYMMAHHMQMETFILDMP